MADAIRFSPADEPAKLPFRLANKVLGAILRAPMSRSMDPVWLLEVEGRRSGRTVRTPVGLHELEGQRFLFGGGRWRLNFDGGHRLVLRQGKRRIQAVGTLVTDLDRVSQTYHAMIERTAEGEGLARASRLTGAKLEAERVPTLAETRAALAEHPRAIVTIDEA